jgi:acyl-CoA reductase-like NAD-dependent aldehyde dehydrogenase
MSTAAAEGLLIGGERVASAEGATFDVLNPATAETLATVAEAGPQDVERAVSAATGAYARWARCRR